MHVTQFDCLEVNMPLLFGFNTDVPRLDYAKTGALRLFPKVMDALSYMPRQYNSAFIDVLWVQVPPMTEVRGKLVPTIHFRKLPYPNLEISLVAWADEQVKTQCADNKKLGVILKRALSERRLFKYLSPSRRWMVTVRRLQKEFLAAGKTPELAKGVAKLLLLSEPEPLKYVKGVAQIMINPDKHGWWHFEVNPTTDRQKQEQILQEMVKKKLGIALPRQIEPISA